MCGKIICPTFLLVAILCGCRDGDQASKIGEENVIIPGYGTKTVHRGMAIEDLGDGWIERKWEGEPLYLEMDNLEQGIAANWHPGEEGMHGCAFIFSGQNLVESGMKPFQGKTDKGISAQSSIEDVIHTYGQPEIMNASSQLDDQLDQGGYELDLYYKKIGLNFFFKYGKLQQVSVSEPDLDFDPKYHDDLGDVSEYRAIVVPKQRE